MWNIVLHAHRNVSKKIVSVLCYKFEITSNKHKLKEVVFQPLVLSTSSSTLEINMQINKIKLALGLVAGLSVAMPMIASAAADQEAAIANPNNWAHPRGGMMNQGYSA